MTGPQPVRRDTTADYADLRAQAAQLIRAAGRPLDGPALEIALGVCASVIERLRAERDTALADARREEDDSDEHATEAHYLGEHVAFDRLRKALPGLMGRESMAQVGFDTEYATALHDVVRLMGELENASEAEAAERRKEFRMRVTTSGPATEADIQRALKMAEELGGL